MEKMDFATALIAVKNGERVCREGWNGKHYIEYVDTGRVIFYDGEKKTGERKLDPFIAISTQNGEYKPWVASASDLLSTDWIEI